MDSLLETERHTRERYQLNHKTLGQNYFDLQTNVWNYSALASSYYVLYYIHFSSSLLPKKFLLKNTTK